MLVDELGARPPGSPTNRQATAYVHEVLAGCDLDVSVAPFTTRWWEPGTGWLEHGTQWFEVAPNPYSPAGDVRGDAMMVSNVEELEALAERPGPSAGGSAGGADLIVVLEGELTREQLMPAVFPFLDLPEHERIRTALHRVSPAAVVAVSDHWEPILEDPDLPFPSTTISTTQGRRLRDGDELRLAVTGAVHAGEGGTVSARHGTGTPRLVLSAHLDSKATTPGAFDNAGGVATLLAMAQTGRLGRAPLELVLFNGEDHVDACGEVAWLERTDLDEVAAACNVDGIGLVGQRTSLAMLGCPPRLEAALNGFVDRHAGWVPTAPWIESDHALFALRDIPAVAVTSEDVHALLGGIAHSPQDTREVVDVATLAGVAQRLPEVLELLAIELLPTEHRLSPPWAPPHRGGR